MGFDGYIMLAILTLFFVYLLPSLIRSAQVVAEARIEDRFSGNLQIIATAGREPKKAVSTSRMYIHPPRKSENQMNTPVVRKLAAADARRVAAARAARAAAASRRVAAAKRRMLLLSVLGALTISGWILTAMVSFPWAIPTLLTALTVGAVELGRRAAAAGAKADGELAEQVRIAEARAGIVPKTGKPATKRASTPSPSAKESAGSAHTEEEAANESASKGAPSLRVEVDPAKQEDDSWTPVPVPPPAYTLKAEARRKLAEPYVQPDPAAVDETPVEQTAEAPDVPAEAE
ncbi:MAG TPA: hypothetical protein VK098_10540, partial [Beutenbergiaceae bacterium]|nr:hypothetical protein [Beutenbergiaceae bacterium]